MNKKQEEKFPSVSSVVKASGMLHDKKAKINIEYFRSFEKKASKFVQNYETRKGKKAGADSVDHCARYRTLCPISYSDENGLEPLRQLPRCRPRTRAPPREPVGNWRRVRAHVVDEDRRSFCTRNNHRIPPFRTQNPTH